MHPIQLVQGYNDIVLLSETVGLQVLVGKGGEGAKTLVSTEDSLFIVKIIVIHNLFSLHRGFIFLVHPSFSFPNRRLCDWKNYKLARYM